MLGGALTRRLVGWVTCLVPLVIGIPLSAQPPARPPRRPAAESPSRAPGSELTISLMTMGVGAEIWERFGHNAIVVEDRQNGTSIAYNYGMFSFRQENFLLRFLQGRMRYWMQGEDTEGELPKYRYLKRSVWLQELNLTPMQRLAMRDFLEWNARQENRFYRYDYYRDNCSTKVRDAIDRVLGGALLGQMTGPASGSYRFHTQRLTANDIPLFTGLLLILGHGVDAPVTKWDEMFLPLKLREYLDEVRVPDSTGTMVALVKVERTLFESAAFPVLDAPPQWGVGYLLGGLLLGSVFVWGGMTGRRSRAARWGLFGAGGLWAAVTGVAGAIMAGLWAFTDHVATARNENVLQASLFALALAVMLPVAMRRVPGALRMARLLAFIVGGLSLLGLLLKVLPPFNQVNGQVLALFVPANVGLMLGVAAWARKAG
jgi:hypothetical protein